MAKNTPTKPVYRDSKSGQWTPKENVTRRPSRLLL
jgi:hypothetical protein